jgi:hypothetical protein
MSVETIVAEITVDNPKKYIDLYNIDEDDPINPLAKVVPTESFFFGTYTLNIIIFTKLYLNIDNDFDDEIEDCKARLIGTYHLFAKYQTHIFIQSDALEIQSASLTRLATMESKLNDLATELAGVGITYHGQMSEIALKDTIESLIASFSAGT